MRALLAGFMMGLSLIVAIGPQNAFVLTSGLRRERWAMVTTICIAGDLLLIAAGVVGLGGVISRVPLLVTTTRVAGAAYLLFLAAGRWRAARHPASLTHGRTNSPHSVTRRALALTFLNPHVYLDTVVLLGSISTHWGSQRWIFAVGAGSASLVWFLSLGGAARRLAPMVRSARVWTVIDIITAGIMVIVAMTLILGA
jgi:L-lysine exporter family protein LysE/ArgO